MTIAKLNLVILFLLSILLIIIANGSFGELTKPALYLIFPSLIFSIGALVIKPNWSVRRFTFGYIGLGLAILIIFITIYLGIQKVVPMDAAGAGVWFLIGFPIISIILYMFGVLFGDSWCGNPPTNQ
ncbi:hypothetical protein [Brumicola pallidula]|uniref:Uncharacterized protein n=1 Tax=Brumicola pallidula DSM 14239 = ACAM 615 TaxID=1121922 RepID=K6YTZ1_9ALTE|nr:hypothetical protein [Glaciecola pallidula]GAC27416.1 hypothetical protein GPAL_0536 [Glaciecola pallidula DSM 14239 = ACAM 615]